VKIRHVRAIAVFGIAIIALTGARGSSGGSCGGSSSSGSGSSSSGGSNDNSTTTGGTTGSVSGGSSANKVMRDVRIDKCGLDATGKNLTAKITITNSASLAYAYDVSLKFKGDLGDDANTATARIDDLQVAANGSQVGEASTPYTGSGDGSEYKKCEVVSATRTAS
jgi:hypothetical protein